MPAATCALVVVPSDSESQAGMDSMRSVPPVLEVAGTCPCMEPRDGFLDLNTFFEMLFISLKIDDQCERERFLDYISGVEITIIYHHNGKWKLASVNVLSLCLG